MRWTTVETKNPPANPHAIGCFITAIMVKYAPRAMLSSPNKKLSMEENNISEVVPTPSVQPTQSVQLAPAVSAVVPQAAISVTVQPVVAQADNTRLSTGVQYLGKTVSVFLHILVFLILIRAFVVEPAIVNGRSMEMTLVDTDRVLVNKLQILFDAPDRYDIIQMYDEVSGNYYIKRVIGLPGETVVISGGAVCIEDVNGVGTCLDEFYLQDFIRTAVKNGEPSTIPIPENRYFVMGDNRIMSTDSRDLGPIDRRYLLGNVMMVE